MNAVIIDAIFPFIFLNVTFIALIISTQETFFLGFVCAFDFRIYDRICSKNFLLLKSIDLNSKPQQVSIYTSAYFLKKICKTITIPMICFLISQSMFENRK